MVGDMVKGDKFSEFEAYLEEQRRGIKRSLSQIEKVGTETALNRCRELAREIQSRLHDRKPGHFGDVFSIADLQVSLERAASVLEHKSRNSES
jgi:glutathione S-transferase